MTVDGVMSVQAFCPWYGICRLIERSRKGNTLIRMGNNIEQENLCLSTDDVLGGRWSEPLLTSTFGSSRAVRLFILCHPKWLLTKQSHPRGFRINRSRSHSG